ncbi:unnamed protein product [Paramecium sonneborni]|uniref:Uncharacterized protein n=1 Tax=Paramecium sonneborni TaxID=65129 RepID=A0A8S1M0L9_9CILI|nr:unnamed protein product [Paramecium sonneborni]
MSFNQVLKCCYSFLHKQIQEFFVGKYILRLIQDFQSAFQNRSVEENIETSSFNQNDFNLSLSNFYGELNMIKVDLQNYDNIKETLINLSKL